MRIVALADAHGEWDRIDLPEGDVLVVAGDMTKYGSERELEEFADWLAPQLYMRVFIVPGNHDLSFQTQPVRSRAIFNGIANVLTDSGDVYKGIRFYGSPWTKAIVPEWVMRFAYVRKERDLWEKYNRIPRGIDVLITHGPSYGILDRTDGLRPGHAGSTALRVITDLRKPKLHIFGHIHEGYGGLTLPSGRKCVNVSVMNRNYHLVNDPVVLEV